MVWKVILILHFCLYLVVHFKSIGIIGFLRETNKEHHPDIKAFNSVVHFQCLRFLLLPNNAESILNRCLRNPVLLQRNSKFFVVGLLLFLIFQYPWIGNDYMGKLSNSSLLLLSSFYFFDFNLLFIVCLS